MEILLALGVNSTLWFQLAAFVICYLALSQLIFKPYLHAFQERASRTSGKEEAALQIQDEVQSLHRELEIAIRDLNVEQKHLFDEVKSQARKDYDAVLAGARQQAQSLLEKSRKQLATEMAHAKKEIGEQAPSVGAAITRQLAGKEIGA